MDRLASDWGANLKERRQALLMTQTELARRVGVTRNAVSMWESGARRPGDDHKARLAGALRQSVRSLFPLAAVDAA